MRNQPRAFALLSVIAILGAAGFLAAKASIRASDALSFAQARFAAGQARSAAEQKAFEQAARAAFFPSEPPARTYLASGLIDINQSDPRLLAKALMMAGESAAQAQTYSVQIVRGRPWSRVEAMFSQLRIGQGGLARYWMTTRGQAVPQALTAPGPVAGLLEVQAQTAQLADVAFSPETEAFADGTGMQGGRSNIVVRLEYLDDAALASVVRRTLSSDQVIAANQSPARPRIRPRP